MKISAPRLRSWQVGFLAAALALALQTVTVHYNYGGNWSALFCTGTDKPLPPMPEFRNTFQFVDTGGYDGQFYRYAAHDPFFTRGLDKWMDAPRLRRSRVLVPMLAYALALGQQQAIDTAYIAVILGFVFLGAYCCARFAGERGFSQLWGGGFLCAPATIGALDRMTVDIAATALACAWAVLWTGKKKPSAWAWIVLAALPLVRETGLLLSLAVAFHLAFSRQFRELAKWALTLVPVAVWLGFVFHHTGPVPADLFSIWPMYGWWEEVLHPVPYPARIWARGLLIVLDDMALAGTLLAVVFSIQLWWRRRTGAMELGLLLFALFITQNNHRDSWVDAYAYGRIFAPLLMLLALSAMDTRKLRYALPLPLVTPRVAIALAVQLAGFLRGLGLMHASR